MLRSCIWGGVSPPPPLPRSLTAGDSSHHRRLVGVARRRVHLPFPSSNQDHTPSATHGGPRSSTCCLADAPSMNPLLPHLQAKSAIHSFVPEVADDVWLLPPNDTANSKIDILLSAASLTAVATRKDLTTGSNPLNIQDVINIKEPCYSSLTLTKLWARKKKTCKNVNVSII